MTIEKHEKQRRKKKKWKETNNIWLTDCESNGYTHTATTATTATYIVIERYMLHTSFIPTLPFEYNLLSDSFQINYSNSVIIVIVSCHDNDEMRHIPLKQYITITFECVALAFDRSFVFFPIRMWSWRKDG